MKGAPCEDSISVQPARTANASEMEGREGLRAPAVGMSWVRSRALELAPSVIPSFKLKLRPHSWATLIQSLDQLLLTLGAFG